jgi:outer membrane protein assembly factor BamB
MEFLMTRVRIVLALAVIALAGCSGRYTLDREHLNEPAPWPFFRGHADASGAVDGAFNGRLSVVWQHRTNGKPAGPLTVYYGTLVYPGTRKKVEFFDIATGDLLGKLKSGGYTQAGMVMSDSLGFYLLDARKHRLQAVNLLNHDDLWQLPVKEAAGGTILVNNSLIIGCASGQVLAVDPADGSTRWQTETGSRVSVPPSAGHGLIFQPVGQNQIVALDAADGSERYRVTLPSPVAAPVAVGSVVVAADIGGTVTAIVPSDGSVVWRQDVGHPIWAAPAVSETSVIVGTNGGDVVALDPATGKIRWRYHVLTVVRAAPLIAGSFVVTATMAGEVFVLNRTTGDLVDRVALKGAVTASPVTDGRRVVVATDKGYITCFGETDEHKSRSADARIHSQDGS